MSRSSQLLPKHKDHLTIGLVRSEPVLQRAVAVLEPADFDPQTERQYAIVYAVAQSFYKSYRRLIPKDLMLAELERRITGDPDWAQSLFLQRELEMLIDLIWMYPMEQYAPSVAVDLLQTMLNERKVAPLLTSQHGSDYPDMLQKLNSEYARTRLTAAEPSNPGDFEDPTLEEFASPRTPTGLNVVDLVLGGGVREAEVIGVLGPIGGGKTLTCINTALAMAGQIIEGSDEVIDYFTWEQSLKDIRERLWIAATCTPKQEIEGKRFSELDPSIRRKLNDLKPVLSRFRITDLSGAPDQGGWVGMETVRSTIQQQLAGGVKSGRREKPKACFIDWVGTLARRHMATKNQTDEKNVRGFILAAVDEAKAIADKYRSTIFLAHQLSGEAGSKGPMAEMTQYDASDCKQFTALCSSCLAIGRMDREVRVFKLANAKPSRTGGAAHVWVNNPPDTHQMLHSQWDWTNSYDRGGVAKLEKVGVSDRVGDIAGLPSVNWDRPVPPATPATVVSTITESAVPASNEGE